MPRTKKNLLYSEVTDQLYGKMDTEITNIIEITDFFYMFANFFKDLEGGFRRAEVLQRVNQGGANTKTTKTYKMKLFKHINP